MTRYIPYSDRLEKRFRYRKRFLKFLIFVIFYFFLTNLFFCLYKIYDKNILEVPQGSYVVGTFYYPLFSVTPALGDFVFVGSFPANFWSWGKVLEIFTLGLVKGRWGTESINTTRLYQIIAKEGDVIQLSDLTTIVIRSLGRVEEKVYSLPHGSSPLLSLMKSKEWVLREREYVGFLTGATARDAVHAVKVFRYDQIKAKKQFQFKF